MLEIVSPDDPWRERIAYRVSRHLNSPTRKFFACCLAAIGFTALLAGIFFYITTYMYASYDFQVPDDPEKSAHYIVRHFFIEATDARLYEFVTELPPGATDFAVGGTRIVNLTGKVSQSVATARADLKYSKQLVVVPQNY